MNKSLIFVMLIICLGVPGISSAKSEDRSPRGELLYTTHCIACHNEKIHWRDKKIAKDWAGLKIQVRRWQGIAGLEWSNGDVMEVARYLNARHYHYPEQTQ